MFWNSGISKKTNPIPVRRRTTNISLYRSVMIVVFGPFGGKRFEIDSSEMLLQMQKIVSLQLRHYGSVIHPW